MEEGHGPIEAPAMESWSGAGRAAWRNVLTSQMIPEAALPADSGGSGPSRASASAGELLRSLRCVAAVDMDCFYAQCEELRNPELRGKPVGVQQKMLVITSNYAARAYGIEKGDALRVVREKCPDITICNGEDLTWYGEVSQRVFDLATRWTSKVEKLGLDEVFLDLTELVDERIAAIKGDTEAAARLDAGVELYPPVDGQEEVSEGRSFGPGGEGGCWLRLCIASRICSELRDAIRQEVGLTSSAGISVSKMLAKLVSSWKKPDRQTVLLPTEARLERLLPNALPVQKIPGIGFSSTQKCQEMGVKTIGELLAACEAHDACPLLKKFDERAVRTMRALCLGLDESEVKTSGPPKSCSVEDSFWQAPLRSDREVVDSLQALARKLLVKIRRDERRFGYRNIPTLAVGLRHAADTAEEAVRRERRQTHLTGLRVAMDPAVGAAGGADSVAPPVSPELSSADELKIKQLAERAFGLFRKMVPREPYALNILNIQVQFDELLPSSQRRLQFNVQSKNTSPMRPSDDVVARDSFADDVQCVDLQVAGGDPAPATAAAGTLDSSAMQELTSMGFSAAEAQTALRAVGEVGLQAAVEWILDHRSTSCEGRAAPDAERAFGRAHKRRLSAGSAGDLDEDLIVLD